MFLTLEVAINTLTTLEVAINMLNTRWAEPLGGAIVTFGATQQPLRSEPDGSQGLLCPLLDVVSSMALCLARDQADQGVKFF